MQTYAFPAVMERGETCFGVFFPDLPGCVTVGDTYAEAAEMAREALSLHLSGMLEDGLTIPDPSDPSSWPADPDVDQVGVMMVSARVGPHDAVELTLPASLLERADAEAMARGRTRERVLTDHLETTYATA